MTTPHTSLPASDVLVSGVEGGPGAPLSLEQRQRAAMVFRKLGFLQIEQALSAEHVTRLHEAFVHRYAGALAERDDTVAVGDRRYMSSVELSRPFDDHALYANATILSVVNDVLAGEATLTSFTCVTALSGAGAQQAHTDHPPLFRETGLAALLPPYAVTVIVPLVALGAAQGATAVWLGSHHETTVSAADRRDDEAFVPTTTLGSVYLMDYRLAHRGTPNATGALRPVLSLVYARPWFTDSVNFASARPLRMSREAYAAVPGEFRSLFTQVRFS